MKRVLSETESVSVVNALRVAADTYQNDAEVCRKEDPNGDGRWALQFERQASEARRLAEELDGYIISLEQ